MKTKITLNVTVIVLSTLLAVSLLLATNLISLNYKAEAQQTTTTTIKVQVGGGNNTYPFYGYNPQQIQVKVGSKVVWTTPSNAPIEPHTVTFVLNSKTMTGPDTPFAVPSSTKFIPLPPGSNSEPNIVPELHNERQ